MRKLPVFELEDQQVDGVHVLLPSGEIDALTAPTLGRRMLELIDEGMNRLVVDLSETTFMDSTGLGVLVNGLRQTGRRDGKLVIVCPTERIMRPFEITGLHNHLRIVKTRAEAFSEF
jgi:anti-sigma B factor antagonist